MRGLLTWCLAASLLATSFGCGDDGDSAGGGGAGAAGGAGAMGGGGSGAGAGTGGSGGGGSCVDGDPWPGQVVDAASCELADVTSAVDAATDGDTVVVPACSATWSATLNVGKSVHLQGAGIGQTVITNDQGDGSNPQGADFMTMTVSSSDGGRVRISGFELVGSRTSAGLYLGGGPLSEIQVDHCSFHEFLGRAIHASGRFRGLVYANRVTDSRKTFDTYGGSQMNESWQTPLSFGTTDMVVYEDNVLEYTAGGWYPGSSAASFSHGQGGRSTWRHNTWTNHHEALDFFPVFDAHGNQEEMTGTDPTAEPPGGDGNHRGTRQVELYANTFVNHGGAQASARITDLRGGSVLIHDNVYESTDGSFYLREEDGDARFDYLQSYPGYDQHRIHIWNNTLDGAPITDWHTSDPDDQTFIIEETNLFFRAPEAGDLLEGYQPLSYPHPWRACE